MEHDLAKLRIDRSSPQGAGRRRRVRPWMAFLLAAVVFALLLWMWPRTADVRVASVSEVYPSRSLTLVNATGYVVADRKAAVASKITSRLEWLGVEEGSVVKRDQVLARLEGRDVAAALERAESDMAAASALIEVARAEYDDAKLNYDRMKRLSDQTVVARSEFDLAVARFRKAQGNLENAKRTLAARRAALEEARAQVEYTVVRAPFDAVVLTKSADVGDIVTPIGASTTSKASVVTLADMASLQIEADVAESNVAKVRPGQSCEIQLDAFGEERFPGHVHMIVPTADRTKATVLVKVRFDPLDPRVLPQMSAKVAFLDRPLVESERAARLCVPQAALVDRNGPGVFVVEDGRARFVRVKTGETLGDMVEALQGVSAGQKVVLSPPASLADGGRVSLVEK
ncbi:efflux RND transporter periplasmic adaptor subunit [Fundidesulfovibrio butyratiphilus]